MTDFQRHETPRELAARYKLARLSVIAVRADGSKKPTARWEKFQEKIATDSELAHMFSRERIGIAIITGAVSGNLEVLDFDNAGVHAQFLAALSSEARAALEKTVRVKTPGRGYHYYYRREDANEGNQKLALRKNADGKIETLVETRGKGGYVIAPGSHPETHASHKPYLVERGELCNIATISDAERELLHSLARSFNEVEVKQRTSITESTNQSFENWDDLNSEARRRILSLDTCRITGQWAHAKGVCHDGRGDTALALNIATGAFVCQANCSTENILEALDLPTRPTEPKQTAETRVVLPFMTAAEFSSRACADIDWSVEGIAATGAVTEIVGKIKGGKTTLALEMVRCVLEDLPFLRLKTQYSPVVYLSEQPETSLRASLKRAGLLERPDLHLLSKPDLGKLLNNTDRQAIWWEIVVGAVAKAKEVGARVLIIDSFSAWVGFESEQENSSDGQKAMEPLIWAASQGLSVISVRHERKSGGDIRDAGRGASGISGQADTIIGLRMTSSGDRSLREIVSASRFDETPDGLIVRFRDGRYEPVGDRGAIRLHDTCRAILDILPESVETAMPLAAIQERLKSVDDIDDVGRSTVMRSLEDLIRRGEVEKTGSGKRNEPFRWFISVQGGGGLNRNKPGGDELVSAHLYGRGLNRNKTVIRESQNGSRESDSAGVNPSDLVSVQASHIEMNRNQIEGEV